METGAAKSSDSEATPEERTPTGWAAFWAKEHEAAEKRLRTFRQQGNGVNQKFLDKRADANSNSPGTSLNLFHTNITTLQSMLCGSTPRIDVSREHHDPDDDIARVASVLFQRILQSDIDPSGEDTPTVLKAALQDRLIPGFGNARVRYDFKVEEVEVIDINTGQPRKEKKVVDESADIEYVHWQDCLWGWGRTWNEIPWWGFKSYLTKEEVEARFGEGIELEYKAQLPAGDEKDNDAYDADQKNNVQKAEIWEFWQESDRKVFWWSQGYDKTLDIVDDPLKLDGFWPIPKPLMANVTTTLFEPKADYIIAQDLYREIDELQSRITTITRAVKVVGVYDENSVGVSRMLGEAVENELIPVSNWAMFAEKGGLDGSVDWFPVGEVVNTLNTLRNLLGDTIELLYQVTGMSDVLRGANTDQYTSDGTNQLKAKFGSIRIQALQDEFARFASDLEALKAEVISKHFSEASILRQSNAQFMPEADKDKIGPALQLMKAPEVKWRIDIRPESIAMVDYAALKSERTEFLTAMATYIQSAGSMIQAVPDSMPILLEMLKWGMAGFKGSNYLEGTMDSAIDQAKKALQQSGGKKDDKQQDGQLKIQLEQLKQQGQQQKAQSEMQKLQMKSQFDMQLLQQKVQGEIARINADATADQTMEQMDARNELIKIEAKLKADIASIQANLAADMDVERAQSTFAIAEEQVQHANTMTEQGNRGE